MGSADIPKSYLFTGVNGDGFEYQAAAIDPSRLPKSITLDTLYVNDISLTGTLIRLQPRVVEAPLPTTEDVIREAEARLRVSIEANVRYAVHCYRKQWGIK